VVKHRGGICDVVERKAGDDGIQRGIWHVVPEGDPPVSRSSRRFGIDAQGVVGISFRSWRTPGERRDLIESPGEGLGVLIGGR